MTDEELITQLRNGDHFDKVMCAPVAADRIEELVKERDEWMEAAQSGFDANMAILERAQAAEAALKEVMATVNATSTLSSDR